MVKETGEITTAIIDFLGKPKIVLTVFLGSAAWLFYPVQQRLPIPGNTVEYANLIASVLCILTFACLTVSGLLSLYQKLNNWRHSPQRILRKATEGSTPVEKLLLQAVINRGEYTIGLDVGSPLAMHLQQIGLITKSGFFDRYVSDSNWTGGFGH